MLAVLALLAASDWLPAQLQLPAALEQTLPLSKRASFGGDALRVVDCPEKKDHPYGICGNDLFGGFVLFDSHFEGSVRIRFSPPENDRTHFQIFVGELQGEDTVITAPRLFGEFPLTGHRVIDVPNQISSGDLNLATGEVTNLDVTVRSTHSGIRAIEGANPNLVVPDFRFPGEYGDAWMKFEQRPDGLLDFTLHVSTFLPLGKELGGDPVRFPLLPCLDFVRCVNVPARGTSLHPHLYLTTKEPDDTPCEPNCPDIPFNTVREYTLFTHSSSFGDDFELNIGALGGPAPGRSHLAGRLRIQFGAPTPMGTVPFVLSPILPKGFLAEPPEGPLNFPGIVPGLIGYNEYLRFPLQSYFLKDVALADDPFDYAEGVVDLRTGRVIGEFRLRAFFAQNLLFAVLAVNEGRIPAESFRLRGPARFERGAGGQTVFRFQGGNVIPYAGFRFPTPLLDPLEYYVAGSGSELHIFVNLQAMESRGSLDDYQVGGEENVESSRGERFSYSYAIPCDGVTAPAAFTYTNLTRGETFLLRRLASVTCTNSRTATVPEGSFDTVTFSGFGTWSRDANPHFANVQISTSPDFPYVGIHIDGGFVSNVNTKPAEKPIP